MMPSAAPSNPLPDPFEVLGLSARFDLDPQDIEHAWLQLSAQAHPDRAADATEAARTMARINEARRILTDPERRANALLSRLGGPGSSEDRSLPDGYLPEILALREDMEEQLAGDDTASRQRLQELAEERRHDHIQRISAMFHDIGDTPTPDELHSIRVELNAWRYTERMIEQLDPDYDPAQADFRD